jgi:deoxyribodipyrimidine photo-lyase
MKPLTRHLEQRPTEVRGVQILTSKHVPDIRIVRCNLRAPDSSGDYVLYWMTAFARTGWNFSLQRAVEWTRELNRPLVVLHTLYISDRWDSDRLCAFAIDGMRDIAGLLGDRAVRYYPYIEPRKGSGAGLVGEMTKRACVVVTDDFPSAVVDRLISSEADVLPVLLEKVDSNGMLPLRSAERVFLTAASFRKFLQNNLEPHLEDFPLADPLRLAWPLRSTGRPSSGGKAGNARRRGRARKLQPAESRPLASIKRTVLRRWPPASTALLRGERREIEKLNINHSVPPVNTKGGMKAAGLALKSFIKSRLDTYAALRNHPDEDATSGLSPYLHFGHISTHQVVAHVTKHGGVPTGSLQCKLGAGGRGWWGLTDSAQAFIDQLLTWRELGFNMAWQWPEYGTYQSLPTWARKSLKVHARDRRVYVYSPADLEAAGTHDRLWNAAQHQLATEGRLHNYLRMVWGKKILEWSTSPEEALDTMIELNNKYALDGRDPNSYSGIFWVLGRYDRPWGPRRPVFGTIRYMSSDNTMRKVRVRKFLERYAPQKGY